MTISTLNKPKAELTAFSGPGQRLGAVPGSCTVTEVEHQQAPSKPDAATIENPPKASENNDRTRSYGLREVLPGVSPVADMIFIHGLNGDSLGTWSDNNTTKEEWKPLSNKVQNARIMTWGYDAGIDPECSSLSLESVSGHANTLLSDMLVERSELPANSDRRIVFICHNLGGIIVKQALQRAKLYSPGTPEASILASTIGIVFLGTPHRGVKGAEDDVAPIWRKLFESLGDAQSKIPTHTPHLLNIMQPGSPFLDGQRNEWSLVGNSIKIVCAYEHQDSENTVVSKHSAILDGYNVKEVSVPTTHQNMCRIDGQGAAGWRRIMYEVNRWVKEESGPQATPEDRGKPEYQQESSDSSAHAFPDTIDTLRKGVESPDIKISPRRLIKVMQPSMCFKRFTPNLRKNRG